MENKKNPPSLFDDDFEVTYEEEVPFSYSFDTNDQIDSVPTSKDSFTDRTVVSKRTHKDNFKEEGFKRTDFKNEEENYEENENEDYEENYSNNDPNEIKESANKSSTQHHTYSNKRSAKYGTKGIYQFARFVVRTISILITAGTLGVIAYNFWRGSAPYGDPQTLLSEKNITLASYTAIAALFMLYELAAFFWSLTKVKVRDGRNVYREDRGRGLFSFVFIYSASYLSFLLTSLLPENFGSYALFNGVRGALEVFGSLHNTLLGLCLAGVVFCLVRKNMN